jgi:glycogen operon protein
MLDAPTPSPTSPLGVVTHSGGGQLRVWSAHATAIEVCFFDSTDPEWITERVALTLEGDGVWFVDSASLVAGASYSLRASGPTGPTHHFDPNLDLIDPYAKGLERTPSGGWRSYVHDESFDWQGVAKPQISPDHVLLYEAHAKGLSKLNPDVPEDLRGTYAGIGHAATISYLTELGVTSVQLLPVQQSVSEQRLIKQGLTNYWGYNTLNFFTPHSEYATAAAQAGGAGAVLHEFKAMVRSLHAAGIQVILDVVYNHTAEEGPTGPTTSLRGLDNASYYRQDDEGNYIDVTGCGNTVNFSVAAAQNLVLDSLAYWFNEVQVDGFRFDLMATLGRDENVNFVKDHPLLKAILDDPRLQGALMISEPWDVGMGGWQVGNFPDGYSEWNDGYRDRARDFWLTDIGAARANGIAPNGIGSLARRLAGSAHVFAAERGPLASVNFITAHDGFTMADLTSYYTKHNLGNGEHNRDGSNNNRSFNHGTEGPTSDEVILATRYKAMRNLLGTLLLSAGIPMLTAGDEWGRTQRGNNNAYCHDSDLTWLHWDHDEWQNDLFEVAATLTRLRRENPALRPRHFGRFGETVPSATQMDWYNKEGLKMTDDDWDSAAERTLQYLAASTPEVEDFNRILLVVHGLEDDVTVTLPTHEGVEAYTLLWDSAQRDLSDAVVEHGPGTELLVSGASMQLFRAR